jgi:exodeoxyribonuclease-3
VASDVVSDIPDLLADPQRRVLAANYGDLRVINLYVPNGGSLDSEKYPYKLDWLSKVKKYIHNELKKHKKLVVLGDFNVAPHDLDVHDPVAWQGNVLVSGPERKALQEILDLGLVDSYRALYPEEVAFSWWDYREAAFRRNRGLRIDLILLSQFLMDDCLLASVDKTPRGWEQPSDHTPIIVELKQS